MSSFLKALLLLFLPGALFSGDVWIDTDPSVQPGGHEVDDGFALLQAFHSSGLHVKGISVVFGNAPLVTGLPIARQIVELIGPKHLPLYVGAAGPDDLGTETAASRALVQALRSQKLTILALGPATNIATVLQTHPELAKQIERVIAVAGRRPGQHFSTGTSVSPFRDFNFELDPKAFQIILDSGVPLVLAPWEISSKVWLYAADLDKLAASDRSLNWLTGPASDWLSFWKRSFHVDGFNPFDTLAVGYATRPDLFHCETLPIRIESLPDDTLPSSAPVQNKPYLLVSANIDSKYRARYCFEAEPQFKADLMSRLITAPRRAANKN